MSIFDVFEAAQEVPNRVAVVHAAGECTYRELSELAREQASLFAAQGLLHESWVLLEAEGTLEHIARALALIAHGVPMVMVHPRLSHVEKTRIAQLVQGALSAGDVAFGTTPLAVFFTSGTSGVPKGAVLSAEALKSACALSASNLGWQDEDRWLLSIPLAHIGGFSVLLRCLSARRTVVLGRPGAEGLVQGLQAHRVTLASLVPTQLYRLLQIRPRFEPPAHLRALLIGGAAAPQEMLQEARERGLPVLSTYGLTETCAQVATQAPGESTPPGSVGRPLAKNGVRIDQGQIQVRGPALMTGYLGEPTLATGAWFDTGDLGWLDAQGYLYVQGRRSDLVITGGENVYPQEVEAGLRSLVGVKDAHVFGREDPQWGQVVCAVLVLDDALQFQPETLQEALRGRLAHFKCPKLWATAEVLPLTASGKPDRRATALQFVDALEPA